MIPGECDRSFGSDGIGVLVTLVVGSPKVSGTETAILKPLVPGCMIQEIRSY